MDNKIPIIAEDLCHGMEYEFKTDKGEWKKSTYKVMGAGLHVSRVIQNQSRIQGLTAQQITQYMRTIFNSRGSIHKTIKAGVGVTHQWICNGKALYYSQHSQEENIVLEEQIRKAYVKFRVDHIEDLKKLIKMFNFK